MRIHPLSLLTLALAGAVACVADLPTSTATRETPVMLTGGCEFTPVDADLGVDSTVTFFPGEGCELTKRKATLTWANPQSPVRAGMGVTSGCPSQVDYRTGVFKVRRCATGLVTLTIYTDSVGSAVLQTIPITDL